MRVPQEQNHFIHCGNSQDIPESYCETCLHTLVARTAVELKAREQVHRCAAPADYRIRTVGRGDALLEWEKVKVPSRHWS